jgi:hypothetical protein
MKNQTAELAITEDATMTAPSHDSLQSVLTIVERAAKDPAIDIDKMERLLAMAERMQAKDAERQFNAAFVKLQGEIPVIVATSVIPNRGKYERFEDVMQKIGPLLVANGFTVSFSMEATENRILETCHLKHVGGHSQSNSFAVRAGGKADSDTQADCKAATTAKRNALLNCLNIVIRQDAYQNEDSDGSLDGAPITWDQAAHLKEQVRATGADEAAFLKFAGAHDYHDIGSARYDSLVAALAKKARK